jgi:hypothetical protein
MGVKMAYLVRIDGQPWAFADLMEVNKDPREANALQLDPQRIAEDPSSQPGNPCYVYLPAPPAAP